MELLKLLKMIPMGTGIHRRKHGWTVSLHGPITDYTQITVKAEYLTDALNGLIAKVKAAK